MKYIKLFIGVLIIFLLSCEKQKDTSSFDYSLYNTTEIPGTDVLELSLNDENGILIEKGYIKNGIKTGEWTVYWSDGKKIKSKKQYIDGKLNGIFIKFNDRNQILELTNYLNDEYHGYHVTYSWARPIKEIYYDHGKINGEMKVYFDKNGKIQKLISFKDGIQNGPFKQYDFEGNLILEYMYNNGEKVSGGPVNTK